MAAVVVREQTANLWLDVATLVVTFKNYQRLPWMCEVKKQQIKLYLFETDSPTKPLSEVLDALMGTRDAWHEGTNILREGDLCVCVCVCVGGGRTKKKKDVFNIL